MSRAHILQFRNHQPRRNLPLEVSRKRGESNFVSAFAKAFISRVAPEGLGGSEFALPGFGIADFIWMTPRLRLSREPRSGFCIKALFACRKLHAFEMKLTDWRKGLSQAYRYSYFADLALLVVPPATAGVAKAEISLFRELNVGLWSFDKATGMIRRLFTPRRSSARNLQARAEALRLISRKINLRHFRK